MILVALSIAVQPAQSPLLRVGEAARQLSDQAIAGIVRIAEGGSGNAWLLLSSNGAAKQASLDAFLKATTTNPQIRRGKMVSLKRETEWLLAEPGPNGDYAQVVFESRSFDEIQNERDPNLPFRVSGRFEDKDIIDIVNDARFRALPGVRGPTLPRPIRALFRDADDHVRVEIQNLGHAVYRRERGAWVFRYVLNVTA